VGLRSSVRPSVTSFFDPLVERFVPSSPFRSFICAPRIDANPDVTDSTSPYTAGCLTQKAVSLVEFCRHTCRLPLNHMWRETSIALGAKLLWCIRKSTMKFVLGRNSLFIASSVALSRFVLPTSFAMTLSACGTEQVCRLNSGGMLRMIYILPTCILGCVTGKNWY
jgi:hypothetical protein